MRDLHYGRGVSKELTKASHDTESQIQMPVENMLCNLKKSEAFLLPKSNQVS